MKHRVITTKFSLYLLQVLYQTERYYDSSFGYELPVRGPGNYVVVLMFCEVYFDAPGEKVSCKYLAGFFMLIER